MKLHLDTDDFSLNLATDQDVSEQLQSKGVKPESGKVPVILTFSGLANMKAIWSLLDHVPQVRVLMPKTTPIVPVVEALETASVIFHAVFEGGMNLDDAQEKLYELLADLAQSDE